MYKVESDFIYKGYRCVVVFGDMGYRCGYVGVPEGHRLYNKHFDYAMGVSYEDLKNNSESKRGIIPTLCASLDNEEEVRMDMYFNVHGSITYTDGGKESGYPVKSDLWWLGFDCGHYNDGKDIDLVEKLWGDNEHIQQRLKIEKEYPYYEDYEIRTQEYVEQECKNLVEQIIEYVGIPTIEDAYEHLYPLTIITDRYTGIFSGGKFTAWHLNPNDVPEEVVSGDLETMEFFNSIRREKLDYVYGIGRTPDEAAMDLYIKYKEKELVNQAYGEIS